MAESEYVNFADYLRVILRRWRLVVSLSGAGFLLGIFIAYSLPKTYLATASILPPQPEGLFLDPSASLQAGAKLKFLGGTSPEDIWMGILNSRRVRTSVIGRLNLQTVFKAPNMDIALALLGNIVRCTKGKEGIISISAVSRDPRLAADIANAFVDELDLTNRGLVTTSGRRIRKFTEERIASASRDLAAAEEAMGKFQEAHKALRIDDQAGRVATSIGTLQGEIIAKDVELQTLLSYVTPDHPRASLLRKERDGLAEKLKELEGSGGAGAPDSVGSVFPSVAQMPQLAIQYANLLRAVKTQQSLYELLVQQCEMAKILEAKDTPTVQVLDRATVPERKYKPQKLTIILEFAAGSAVFAVCLAFLLENLRGGARAA